MARSEKTLSGHVVQRRVSAGSKSDRSAVLLETNEGDLILRRKGGNPFRDAVIDALVGQRIEAHGVLAGPGTFIIDHWETSGGDGDADPEGSTESPEAPARLPRALSVRAKKRVLEGVGKEPVRCQVSVAANVDPTKIRAHLDALGAEILSWSAETNLLTLTLPSERLVELARSRGVTYVELGSRYSR